MRAVVYSQYGPPEVLKLTEVDKPLPRKNEILVRIHATTVTSGDVRLRASDFPPLFWLPARLIFGLFKPKKKVLGHEFSGVVEAKGEAVDEYELGDAVFGTTTMLPYGSYADYICVPTEWKSGVVGLKPNNLSFPEAAALPVGGMTALFLLEKAKIKKGDKVLVYGASGSVGSYAVQIANYFGAFVTGVCSSSNIDMVKGLGAEGVIDYKKEDFTSLDAEFDIVLDAVGKTGKANAKKVLKAGGTFVSVQMLTTEKKENLQTLKSLAEQGELTPFIDKSYPLEEIVAAHRYVGSGRKKGNVVIQIRD